MYCLSIIFHEFSSLFEMLTGIASTVAGVEFVQKFFVDKLKNDNIILLNSYTNYFENDNGIPDDVLSQHELLKIQRLLETSNLKPVSKKEFNIIYSSTDYNDYHFNNNDITLKIEEYDEIKNFTNYTDYTNSILKKFEINENKYSSKTIRLVSLFSVLFGCTILFLIGAVESDFYTFIYNETLVEKYVFHLTTLYIFLYIFCRIIILLNYHYKIKVSKQNNNSDWSILVPKIPKFIKKTILGLSILVEIFKILKNNLFTTTAVFIVFLALSFLSYFLLFLKFDLLTPPLILSSLISSILLLIFISRWRKYLYESYIPGFLRIFLQIGFWLVCIFIINSLINNYLYFFNDYKNALLINSIVCINIYFFALLDRHALHTPLLISLYNRLYNRINFRITEENKKTKI